MSNVVPIDRAARRARGRHPATRATAPHGPAPRGPDPERLVRAVARAYLEVEAGVRPLAQLTPLLAPALDLRLAKPWLGRRPERPTSESVRSVRCCELPGGDIEAVVVVRQGERCTALVVRVERHEGAWRVVELTRPDTASETGPVPAALVALS